MGRCAATQRQLLLATVAPSHPITITKTKTMPVLERNLYQLWRDSPQAPSGCHWHCLIHNDQHYCSEACKKKRAFEADVAVVYSSDDE